MTSDAEPKCWICLGGTDEPPPMGTMEDARDFIKPCYCSLQAHRRCLLDWISEMDLKVKIDNPLGTAVRVVNVNGNNNQNNNRDDENIEDENNNNDNNLIQNNQLNLRFFTPGLSHGILRFLGLRPSQRSIVFNVACPQCKTPIFVKIPSSRLLSTVTAAKVFFRQLVKYLLLISIISSVVSGVLIGATVTMIQIGSNVFNVLVPRNIQPRLFGIRHFGSLENAISNGILSPSQTMVLPMIPVYMLALRGPVGSWLSESICIPFPFWFYIANRPVSLYDPTEPRFFLHLINPARAVYDFCFKMTLNRIYFRWVTSLRPCFIADRISKEELLEIERDNQEEASLNEMEELSRQKENGKNTKENQKKQLFIIRLLQSLKDLINGKPASKARRALNHRRRQRELKAIMTTDYSAVFRQESRFLMLLTTCVWPYAGKFLSDRLLSRFSVFNNLGSSPDESQYVRNLIGCLVAVVIKDLASLFFSWLKMRELRNMQILEVESPEWVSVVANIFEGAPQEATAALAQTED